MEHLDEATQPKTLFEVIVNHEEQYTIHRKGKPVPLGWRLAGKVGDKEECLAYIKEVWTDMTPLSLRRSHAQASEPAAQVTAASESTSELPAASEPPATPEPNSEPTAMASTD
jgi:MbtH protein